MVAFRKVTRAAQRQRFARKRTRAARWVLASVAGQQLRAGGPLECPVASGCRASRRRTD